MDMDISKIHRNNLNDLEKRRRALELKLQKKQQEISDIKNDIDTIMELKRSIEEKFEKIENALKLYNSEFEGGSKKKRKKRNKVKDVDEMKNAGGDVCQ